MQEFDNFNWLCSSEVVKENKLPDESVLTYKENGGFSIGLKEFYFVGLFYSIYVREFGYDFLCCKINTLRNETAKVWANYAISRIPSVLKYANETFEEKLEDLLCRLKHPQSVFITDIFKRYMPFITCGDYYRFAFDNIDSPLYRYFYILLMLMYEDDYPIDATIQYPHNYYDCTKIETCKSVDKCRLCSKCYYLETVYGKDYDFAKEMADFQKELTLDFLSAAPEEQKGKALVKLYESIQQINQTEMFDTKLSLSYDKVLYGEGKPMTGSFFLRWDNVDFFNGFYTVQHPNVPFNKVQPYRIEDKSSRKAFNEVSSLFIKKLPPLHVEAKNGKIVRVLNRADLSSCISIMEHKVGSPDVLKKKTAGMHKVEKKELTSAEAKSLCEGLSSRYLDYLCLKQLNNYKVVCCIEHRVNSSGGVSCEYSFIFTIKVTSSITFLAYENASESRCTYILPISRNSWKESIEKIYDFFASNEVNKRKMLASRLVDLKLPGNYEYLRILHSNYLAWVDRIKYCR